MVPAKPLDGASAADSDPRLLELMPPLAVLVPTLLAQAQAPVRPASSAGTVPAWTVRLSGDIRWQQMTPAGALLVSTDGALAGVDVERGQRVVEDQDADRASPGVSGTKNGPDGPFPTLTPCLATAKKKPPREGRFFEGLVGGTGLEPVTPAV